MVHRFAKVREGNVTLCMFQFLHAALSCVVLGWDFVLTCALHLAHRSLFCGNAAFERPSELKNVAQCIPASLLWLIFHQATRGSYSGLVAAAVVATVAVVVPILETTRLNGIQSRRVARSQIANVHVPHPKTKIGFTFSDLESGLVLGFSKFFHHLVHKFIPIPSGHLGPLIWFLIILWNLSLFYRIEYVLVFLAPTGDIQRHSRTHDSSEKKPTWWCVGAICVLRRGIAKRSWTTSFYCPQEWQLFSLRILIGTKWPAHFFTDISGVTCGGVAGVQNRFGSTFFTQLFFSFFGLQAGMMLNSSAKRLAE